MLEAQIRDSKKKAILEDIKAHAEEIWKKDIFGFPHTTIHGIPHSAATIEILNRSLVQYMKGHLRLNETEILILLGATWLHDVGYLQFATGEDFSVVQAEHPIRGFTYINDNQKECGKRFAPLIALLVRGHKDVPQKRGDYADVTLGPDKVRLQFLTALLRLADELELSHDRAPKPLFDLIMKAMGHLPYYTILQWLRYYYTMGIGLEPMVRNGVIHLGIAVNTWVPRSDYERYFVDPWIVYPIRQAVIDVYQALAEEHIVLNTNITSKVMLQPQANQDLMPQALYSEYQQRIIDTESLRSLMRYSYNRIHRFLGELPQIDSTFGCNIIGIDNLLSYGVLNTSSDDRLLPNNGVFMSLSSEIFGMSSSIDEKKLQELLNFKVAMGKNESPHEIGLKCLPMKTFPSPISKMPLEPVMEKLDRLKLDYEETTFVFFESVEKNGCPYVKTTLAYLEPIHPGETLNLQYSWMSRYLPWDLSSTTFRLPTKGVTFRFADFPDSYIFGMQTNIFLPPGEERMIEGRAPPIIEWRSGKRNVEISHFVAPGTQILTWWRDSALKEKWVNK